MKHFILGFAVALLLYVVLTTFVDRQDVVVIVEAPKIVEVTSVPVFTPVPTSGWDKFR